METLSRVHGGMGMSFEDVEYFTRRAAAERVLAQQSGRQNVREIHLELARRYDAIVRQGGLRARFRIVPTGIAA